MEDYEQNVTREQQKAEAVRLMKELDIFDDYVHTFVKDDIICHFEGCVGGGYFIDKGTELAEEITSFEKKTNNLVFAVTHSSTAFGELYDFLCVSPYKEDWNKQLRRYDNGLYEAFSYCWNQTDDFNSEFGYILIKTIGGGFRRVV